MCFEDVLRSIFSEFSESDSLFRADPDHELTFTYRPLPFILEISPKIDCGSTRTDEMSFAPPRTGSRERHTFAVNGVRAATVHVEASRRSIYYPYDALPATTGINPTTTAYRCRCRCRCRRRRRRHHYHHYHHHRRRRCRHPPRHRCRVYRHPWRVPPLGSPSRRLLRIHLRYPPRPAPFYPSLIPLRSFLASDKASFFSRIIAFSPRLSLCSSRLSYSAFLPDVFLTCFCAFQYRRSYLSYL